MESLEEKIKLNVEKYEKAFADSECLEKYTEISEKFDALVKKGVTKRRGNCLLSITDIHVMDRVVFNTQVEV